MVLRIRYLAILFLLIVLMDLAFAREKHKRRRHYRDGGFRVDNILAQMDSFVRPRFGRSIGYAEWRDHGHTGIDVT
ncbi:hypothetical protein CAEBREN_09553 [Caenorhabditis brenneri]|uniref:Uncharacterized protein n=1 Tax=Caenorhabditis brenneri TaxID=135651 RepID=G0M886_CAEBE|nr:hypothetical protein CAEBREN_09553 [Caenorhabditis brenneri]